MAYKIIQQLLTPNKYSRPQTKLKCVKGVVIHWVANPNASARANRNFFESRKDGKSGFGSAHEVIDLNGDIIVCLPKDEMAYQVGTDQPYKSVTNQIYTPIAWERLNSTNSAKTQPYPNDCTYGIECTHIDWNGVMTKETYNSLVSRVADLCKLFKLDPLKDVYTHQEIVGWKDCHRWFVHNPNEWSLFKQKVKTTYDSLSASVVPPVTQPKVEVKYNTLTQERMFNTDIFSYKFKQSDITLKYVVEAGLTVSQIRKKYNADLAINANYITGNSNIGNSKIGDKIISTGSGKTLKWNSFGYRNGNVEIGTLNFQDKWDFIVQSSPMVIDGGKSVYEASIKNDQTNPDIAAKDATPQRTFVIIDKNGDISFVIADGRTPASSTGLTIDNICEFAKSQNAQLCLNFDGGSSTSMSSKDKGSIGQNSGEHETAVHHALLVFVKNNNGGGNVDTSKLTPVHVDLVDSTHNAMNSIDGILIDNQTYVKLSDIAGFYGSKVDWDDINKSASLVK